MPDKRTGKDKTMEITEVKVRKVFDEGPMKAVVSITFDNELALHDVKIVSSGEKTFVVMPARKNPNGEYRDIIHPINAHARAAIESAVISAYEDYLKTQPSPSQYSEV